MTSMCMVLIRFSPRRPVAPRGEHDGPRGALHDGRRAGPGKEGDGFIEHVARLDVGQHEGVGPSAQGALDALDGQGSGVAGGAHVEGPVHEGVAPAPAGGGCLNGGVARHVGKLVAGLLRAVDQGHARLLHAEAAAGVDDVAHLGLALLLRGIGYDGRIGEEEQFAVGRQLGGGQVGEHGARGQQARLLVEHGAQHDVAAHEALHEHVGPAFAHEGHGACRGFGRRGGLDKACAALCQRGGGTAHGFDIAHEDGLGHALVDGAAHGFECGGVAAAYDGHAQPGGLPAQGSRHVG